MLNNYYKKAPRRLKKLLRESDISLNIEQGWFNIVEEFLIEYNKLNTIKIRLIQIKQKLGGLRIYYTTHYCKDNEKNKDIILKLDKLIIKYEKRADLICEFCGKPKTDVEQRKPRYWIFNCCEDCFDIKKQELTR